MGNKKFNEAKRAKNDEFYTSAQDIENELYWYKDQLKDKIIYLPCDDPSFSKFWWYFHVCFNHLGLKKLIATHYVFDNKTYVAEYMGGNDEDITVMNAHDLLGNGDFRNEECLKYMDEADIIITNPPFSLFREFVKTLLEHEKKFLVLGNMNAINYLCPLFKYNKMWSGYAFNKTMDFTIPDNYELTTNGYIDDEGKKHGKVPAISWFTNLEVKKRHEPLIMVNKYDPEKNLRFDNYNAINVDKISNIPYDYYEPIGVPITYIGSHNPDQFDIIGVTYSTDRNPDVEALRTDPKLRDSPFINGKKIYPRVLIKRKQEVNNENNGNENKN